MIKAIVVASVGSFHVLGAILREQPVAVLTQRTLASQLTATVHDDRVQFLAWNQMRCPPVEVAQSFEAAAIQAVEVIAPRSVDRVLVQPTNSTSLGGTDIATNVLDVFYSFHLVDDPAEARLQSRLPTASIPQVPLRSSCPKETGGVEQNCSVLDALGRVFRAAKQSSTQIRVWDTGAAHVDRGGTLRQIAGWARAAGFEPIVPLVAEDPLAAAAAQAAGALPSFGRELQVFLALGEGVAQRMLAPPVCNAVVLQLEQGWQPQFPRAFLRRALGLPVDGSAGAAPRILNLRTAALEVTNASECAAHGMAPSVVLDYASGNVAGFVGSNDEAEAFDATAGREVAAAASVAGRVMVGLAALQVPDAWTRFVYFEQLRRLEDARGEGGPEGLLREAVQQWEARDVLLGFYGRVSPRRLVILNEIYALVGVKISVPRLPRVHKSPSGGYEYEARFEPEKGALPSSSRGATEWAEVSELLVSGEALRYFLSRVKILLNLRKQGPTLGMWAAGACGEEKASRVRQVLGADFAADAAAAFLLSSANRRGDPQLLKASTWYSVGWNSANSRGEYRSTCSEAADVQRRKVRRQLEDAQERPSAGNRRPYLWVPNGGLSCDSDDTPELHRLSEAGATVGIALSETRSPYGLRASYGANGDWIWYGSRRKKDADSFGPPLVLEGDILEVAAALRDMLAPAARPVASARNAWLAALSAAARKGWFDLVDWHRDWIASAGS